MSLGFLTPGTAAPEVVARSPMEPPARAAGGRFEVRDGWNLATGFGRPADAARATVGWADVSHVPKIELQGSAEAIDDAAGTPLRFGTAVRRDGAWWCRLTATRALLLGGATGGAARVEAAAGISAVDVSTVYAGLTLVGPLARETFARFCALDLRPAVTPVGGFRPGSVARQPGLVLREAAERYLWLFGWAVAESMWTVVQDAAQHLGGGPIGIDALEALPDA